MYFKKIPHGLSPAFTFYSNIKGISMTDINSCEPHLNVETLIKCPMIRHEKAKGKQKFMELINLIYMDY